MLRECGGGIETGGLNRAPGCGVDECAGGVGGAVATVGPCGKKCDALCTFAGLVQRARGGQRELLTAATGRSRRRRAAT